MLINDLNLIKESIQKQLLTEHMFFEIEVLKNFAIFRKTLVAECNRFVLVITCLRGKFGINLTS